MPRCRAASEQSSFLSDRWCELLSECRLSSRRLLLWDSQGHSNLLQPPFYLHQLLWRTRAGIFDEMEGFIYCILQHSSYSLKRKTGMFDHEAFVIQRPTVVGEGENTGRSTKNKQTLNYKLYPFFKFFCMT